MKHIQHLEELLGSLIPANSVLVDHKLTKLTEPGENYASLIRALKITIRNQDGTRETVHIVAKEIPTNEMLQNLFKPQITYVKELNMYAEVIPALMNFQKDQNLEKGMGIFPKYYGGRRNLNESDVVDQDAVILLENLKMKGYSTWDRFNGFDLEGAKVVLKNLAAFHAVPLALKQKQPEAFEKKITSRIPAVDIFDASIEEHRTPLRLKIERFAREVEGGDGNLVGRVREALQKYFQLRPNKLESVFHTIIHNDFWINNIMVKVVDGKIIGVKMVDFQFTEYSSLGTDVVFFLYSSVQMSVVEVHYEQLVKFYYDNLIQVLRKYGCDVSLYTFEGFEEELALAAGGREFFHCVLMTKAIYALPQNVKDLDEMSKDDFTLTNEPSEGELKKATFIIKEFAKRNWI